MLDPFVPRIGGVLSADIAVPEHARELRFYSQVLCTGETPLWREDLMNSAGMPVIGLGAQSPEYAELPLQWMPHIQVEDVAASVERALTRGARELMHGKDADGASQWAVLVDPDGATFGLIPVVDTGALPSTGTHGAMDTRTGCIAWLDLTVPDGSAARDFYAAVIGWSDDDIAREDQDGPYVDHRMLAPDGGAAAALRHARGVHSGHPPVWLIYVPVGDLAESLRRAEQHGGTVIYEAPGTNGEGAAAVIQDPVGAHLGLVSVAR